MSFIRNFPRRYLETALGVIPRIPPSKILPEVPPIIPSKTSPADPARIPSEASLGIF